MEQLGDLVQSVGTSSAGCGLEVRLPGCVSSCSNCRASGPQMWAMGPVWRWTTSTDSWPSAVPGEPAISHDAPHLITSCTDAVWHPACHAALILHLEGKTRDESGRGTELTGHAGNLPSVLGLPVSCSGLVLVYTIDITTGSMQLSHKLELTPKHYPGTYACMPLTFHCSLELSEMILNLMFCIVLPPSVSNRYRISKLYQS